MREGGGKKGTLARKPLFSPSHLLIKKMTKLMQLWMTSCQVSLATMHVLVVFLTVFFFCFPETRNPSNYRYYKKSSNAVVHLKGLLYVTRASQWKQTSKRWPIFFNFCRRFWKTVFSCWNLSHCSNSSRSFELRIVLWWLRLLQRGLMSFETKLIFWRRKCCTIRLDSFLYLSSFTTTMKNDRLL